MMGGLLITFEGGDGCGKSTQIRLLAQRLQAEGHRVRTLREPGGTALGESIRELLLDPEGAGMGDRAELLLYEAARAQLVDEVIEPALAAGDIVLCDRFFDSTTAYQGYGRGLPLADIDQLNRFATRGLCPQLTILLDMDAAVGIDRATVNSTDRLESEGVAFQERVRSGFLARAAAEPDRFVMVDASGSIEQVAEAIYAAVTELIDGFAGDDRS